MRREFVRADRLLRESPNPISAQNLTLASLFAILGVWSDDHITI